MSTPQGPWSPAPPRPDHRAISPWALGLLALWIGAGAAMGLIERPPGLLTFLFVISGWILAVVAHEFGHAFVAYQGGDWTVEAKGYLTLNPLKYTNLATSILLPVIVLALGGIGFPGGAVYLRQDLMRGPLWRSAASLAGPFGTLLVLLLLAGVLAILRSADPGSAVIPAVAFLAFLQATALVLNLMPIPGLDGWGVIRPLLPASIALALAPLERLAILILIGLILLVPQASILLFGAAFAISEMLGVSRDLIIEGLRAFQFWK
ncbi:MAG TPA: site-2 protease family protein [Caulobacteraceae bacterium]|jgi:Zn-dependent protease|nr:site-2 protease family protein [Caulobacteraceae bacterium]